MAKERRGKNALNDNNIRTEIVKRDSVGEKIKKKKKEKLLQGNLIFILYFFLLSAVPKKKRSLFSFGNRIQNIKEELAPGCVEPNSHGCGKLEGCCRDFRSLIALLSFAPNLGIS